MITKSFHSNWIRLPETYSFFFQTDSNYVKLPTLYLLDSIIKNHGKPYKPLFLNNISDIFANVFSVSDKTDRERLLEIRNHWTDILPSQKLYELDKKIYVEYEKTWPFFKKIVQKYETKLTRVVKPKYLKKLEDPIDIVIHNVVCRFETRCKLDLDFISENAWNVDYNPNSGILVMKQKIPYYSTARYD